jgi:hypothetical protein
VGSDDDLVLELLPFAGRKLLGDGVDLHPSALRLTLVRTLGLGQSVSESVEASLQGPSTAPRS